MFLASFFIYNLIIKLTLSSPFNISLLHHQVVLPKQTGQCGEVIELESANLLVEPLDSLFTSSISLYCVDRSAILIPIKNKELLKEVTTAVQSCQQSYFQIGLTWKDEIGVWSDNTFYNASYQLPVVSTGCKSDCGCTILFNSTLIRVSCSLSAPKLCIKDRVEVVTLPPPDLGSVPTVVGLSAALMGLGIIYHLLNVAQGLKDKNPSVIFKWLKDYKKHLQEKQSKSYKEMLMINRGLEKWKSHRSNIQSSSTFHRKERSKSI